ncbi:MAG: DUF5615 family PIN-like protein [Propionibacteriaceae bacterium]|nr:DUF5615 family PIN-like protein [Propionibacteriaceae bacterium]
MSTPRLLLDEHYSEVIATELRARGHDVVAAVSNSDIRGAADSVVFRWAAEAGRRIVTENIKDFRPLLIQASTSGSRYAPLLLVPPRRFPRGRGDRAAAIVSAIDNWLSRDDVTQRPVEDWLT